MSGDRPVVSWSPDLNESGTKDERAYQVFGCASLLEGEWVQMTQENCRTLRFFKVIVSMPTPFDGE